jgi:alkylhydroperoxidase/carboxymuconolactone decarboxylase family protein YurZ
LTKKTDVDEKAKELAAQIPDVMKALSGLRAEVVKDGALSAKTKELMMIGIAVALRCEYCHSDGWRTCSSLRFNGCTSNSG